VARTGRPPVPTEVKRKRGTARPDRMPKPSNVVALPPAAGVPAYPPDLGLAGKRLWDRAWKAAITWLSPDSDGEAVEEACRLADDLAAARTRYRATTDPGDLRALVAASKQFTDALSALGFNPTARARLGVAEVKRVSQLEKLLNERQQRR
jgi:hypothetical protein